mgnify:CR=1 FL=1
MCVDSISWITKTQDKFISPSAAFRFCSAAVLFLTSKTDDFLHNKKIIPNFFKLGIDKLKMSVFNKCKQCKQNLRDMPTGFADISVTVTFDIHSNTSYKQIYRNTKFEFS